MDIDEDIIPEIVNTLLTYYLPHSWSHLPHFLNPSSQYWIIHHLPEVQESLNLYSKSKLYLKIMTITILENHILAMKCLQKCHNLAY